MAKRVAVVLAAGKGTRMQSDLPKVLIEVRGRPMIDYVLDALERAGIERIVIVVGYRAADVKARLAGRKGLAFVEQREQKGTGHAVMVAADALHDHDGPVVIVTGDSPMIQSDSLRRLLDEFETARPACLMGTAVKDDPAGLGRVVRDAAGRFEKIVEEKDATTEERAIREVNMSTYIFECRDLLDSLGQIKDDNAQGELYLTDCPGVLKAAGKDVKASAVLTPREALSINTVEELQIVEQALGGSGR